MHGFSVCWQCGWVVGAEAEVFGLGWWGCAVDVWWCDVGKGGSIEEQLEEILILSMQRRGWLQPC